VTNAKTKTKRVRSPLYVYMLVDTHGDDCGFYLTFAEVTGVAWGPRFHDEYTVVRYRRDMTRLYKSKENRRG